MTTRKAKLTILQDNLSACLSKADDLDLQITAVRIVEAIEALKEENNNDREKAPGS